LGGELSASFLGALDGGASVGCTTEPTWSRYCPATTTRWPGVRPCSTTDSPSPLWLTLMSWTPTLLSPPTPKA
jgi:hypothetical protein